MKQTLLEMVQVTVPNFYFEEIWKIKHVFCGVHQKPPASLRNDLDNSLKLKWSMVEKQLIYMNFKHKNTSYMAS